MIEQAILLRLARDYADRKTKERPTLRAVVLVGSVARAEPPLGDAIDLDLILIDDTIPEPSFDLVRLSENVFVDAQFVRTADYADRKALRAQPYIAPALNDALILHDPRHYFDILQASVRAPYNKPDNIFARARVAFTQAQNIINRFTLWREDPPATPPSFDDLADFRAALYALGQALILLSGQPGDTVGPRKFMVRYEAVTRQYHPELYPLFLAALGVTNFPVANYELFLADWLVLYKSTAQRGLADPLIHAVKRGYYERGFRALVSEGHTLNTLWLFEQTLAACVRGLDPQPDLWQHYVRLTGKDTPLNFGERIRQAEQLLARTDETLLAQANKENVDW